MVVVPFSGGGPLITSILGGHTPIACSAIGNAMELITSKKIKVLAVTAKNRFETLPDVPTLDELGIKDEEAETMTGVFVPAGTPKAIVDLLQKEIHEFVNRPDVKKRILDLGVTPEGDTPEHFVGYVRDEVAKWRRVIDVAKIPKI
jgi:tripartite-type tricarboxylate transporter receptor subunit TctC